MGFKQYVEKFVTGEKFKPAYAQKDYWELFVNPTKSELKNVDRAVITPNGDLYTMKNGEGSTDNYIHIGLVDYLHKQNIISIPQGAGGYFNKHYNVFFAIAEYKGKWYISESYKTDDKLLKVAEKYMTKAKKKNPFLKFEFNTLPFDDGDFF